MVQDLHHGGRTHIYGYARYVGRSTSRQDSVAKAHRRESQIIRTAGLVDIQTAKTDLAEDKIGLRVAFWFQGSTSRVRILLRIHDRHHQHARIPGRDDVAALIINGYLRLHAKRRAADATRGIGRGPDLVGFPNSDGELITISGSEGREFRVFRDEL